MLHRVSIAARLLNPRSPHDAALVSCHAKWYIEELNPAPAEVAPIIYWFSRAGCDVGAATSARVVLAATRSFQFWIDPFASSELQSLNHSKPEKH
jgi:hypothetical protein